jgi:hypothetical protein
MAGDFTSRVVTCGRCGASWATPGDTEGSAWAEVTKLARRQQTVEAIKSLRQHFGLDLKDAKGVLLHVSLRPGVCHRCGATLAGGGLTACPGCGSLNYDY